MIFYLTGGLKVLLPPDISSRYQSNTVGFGYTDYNNESSVIDRTNIVFRNSMYVFGNMSWTKAGRVVFHHRLNQHVGTVYIYYNGVTHIYKFGEFCASNITVNNHMSQFRIF
jgi:hypothetical protein